MKTLLMVFVLLVGGCDTTPPAALKPVIVHLVISYTPDKEIDRIFLTKEQALAYIEDYKESHDYFYEAETLNP